LLHRCDFCNNYIHAVCAEAFSNASEDKWSCACRSADVPKCHVEKIHDASYITHSFGIIIVVYNFGLVCAGQLLLSCKFGSMKMELI
jgi:hypothetical protein